EPESWLFAFLPEQHELQHMLHLLHKLLDPELCAVTQPPTQYTSSPVRVYAGTGGWDSQMLMSHSTSVRGGWGSGVLSAGMTGGLVGIGYIQSKKETMQCLNDHLASYLEKVRSLKADNQRLESKIQKHLEEKGPQEHYFKTIEDVRAQIFANSVDNVQNNAHTVLVKYKMELAMCQGERHQWLRKVIDDSNTTGLHLETEIKALKEELLFMKKNNEEEVSGR
uniref:IF rod domain-containing protein n=1 Tax=Myotis lucifugus TaxID=59463 RepID=G1Q9Y1_MYOLU